MVSNLDSPVVTLAAIRHAQACDRPRAGMAATSELRTTAVGRSAAAYSTREASSGSGGKCVEASGTRQGPHEIRDHQFHERIK